MSRLTPILLLVLGLALIGCSKLRPVTESKSASVVKSQHLSAAEEFHLRGECVKLADKLEEQIHISQVNTSDDWSSNYRADDNRCYVQQSVHERDNSTSAITLYDGQSREVLASALDQRDGSKLGTRYDIPWTPDCEPKSDCGYQEVLKYIGSRMERDRQ